MRNLAVLNDAIQGGYEPSRAFTLACLFTDLHLSLQQQPVESASLDLLQELRTRGFPRGDTERMRILLGALSRLMNPSQRTRGMHRRPYFVEAKALHDLVAGSYPAPPQPGSGAQGNGASGNGASGNGASGMVHRAMVHRGMVHQANGGAGARRDGASGARQITDNRPRRRQPASLPKIHNLKPRTPTPEQIAERDSSADL